MMLRPALDTVGRHREDRQAWRRDPWTAIESGRVVDRTRRAAFNFNSNLQLCRGAWWVFILAPG